MSKSPFIYGNTVSLVSFTNREAELEKLYNNLVSGINTMLISPRRWGKSSLVEKTIGEIRKKELLRQIENFIKEGMIINSENNFVLTKKGKFFADRIAEEMFVL